MSNFSKNFAMFLCLALVALGLYEALISLNDAGIVLVILGALSFLILAHNPEATVNNTTRSSEHVYVQMPDRASNTNSYSRLKAYRNYKPLLGGILGVLILVFFALVGFTTASASKTVTNTEKISDKPSNSIEDETPGITFKWVKVRNIGGRVSSIRRVSSLMEIGDIVVGDDGQKVRIVSEELNPR